MTTYKIVLNDREYKSYKILNANGEESDIEINVVKNKLFNDDIFEIDKDKNIIIVHSSVRSMSNIPGVLVLDTKRTYGKKKRKFLYKIIPDDKCLPEFLVPYNNKIIFNKKCVNKYVVFTFKNWDEKHPMAEIYQVLGSVINLDTFYEYQLYCKSLYASNKVFTKETLQKLKRQSSDDLIELMIQKYKPEDRRDVEIYSIDPENAKDFDDAFSYKETKVNVFLSIYIANVSFWMDVLDIWSSFSQRISTIYLPNMKKPMLPNILSDVLCSLQENQTRFAFTLDLKFDKNYNLLNYEYKNTCIIVKRNFRYETKELLELPVYKDLLGFIRILNRKERYIDNISTSHELISYLMIYMNYISAQTLLKKEVGIFRSAALKPGFECPKGVETNVKKFLKQWNSSGGRYVKAEDKKEHMILELDSYVHITSPIRRLVDLLNILTLQTVLNLNNFNESSNTFLSHWTSDTSLEYINKTMKSIRKVQNNCELLRICMYENTENKKTYNGFIFDKTTMDDGLFQYMIYLPEIKMVNKIVSIEDKDNFAKEKFKLFTFINESNLKKKIRLEFE
tara:strand:+ start:1402 stop:3093 length:1692 start_codon:yes stop_codon:yes gene_type:complete